ncbi:NACHT domain-containing protein [Lachnospiraceae bacterium JLR.KK008]
MDLMNILVTAGLGEMAKTAVKGLLDFFRTDYEESLYDRTYEALQEYLTCSYRSNAMMHTIVFRGIEKTIFDLYIPLTLQCQREEGKRIVVNEKSMAEIMRNHKRSIVIDNAGMGKSTIAKYLATQAVIRKSGIPIMIELRKLKKEKYIMSFIEEQFDQFDKKIASADLKCMLKEGGFIVFFDGYDEIAVELRQTVTEDIRYFIERAPENTYILTSREESELSSFSDFLEYTIQPLRMNEAFALIRKYDNYGKHAEDLITKIKEEENLKVLKEFLTNPLLVSLLYKTYMYKGEIPYKKIEFYKQVYEALFNDHDKSKDAYVHPKQSGLEINDFERVLMALGFLGVKRWQVEYEEKEELIHDIRIGIKNLVGSSPKPQHFLEDIIHAVPLFRKDGGTYRWIHKSFMEYFAAKYICYEMGDRKEALLYKITDGDNGMLYKNMLDFCYELDLKTFRKAVLIPWLTRVMEVEKKVECLLREQAPAWQESEELKRGLLNVWISGDAAVLRAGKETCRIMRGGGMQHREKLEEITRKVDRFFLWKTTFTSEGMFIFRSNREDDVVKDILLMKNVPVTVERKMENDSEKISAWIHELLLEEEKVYYLEQLIQTVYQNSESVERIAKFIRMSVLRSGGMKMFDYGLCYDLLMEIRQEMQEMEALNRELFTLE